MAGRERISDTEGGTASWREVNATTWECTLRMNGKVTTTCVASLKGDVTETSCKMHKADGSIAEDNETNIRVSG